MSRMPVLPFVVLVFLSQIGVGEERVAAKSLPREYVEKAKRCPDFCQTDKRYGEMPGDGLELCAPTAVSNALMWLDEHGFPKLFAAEHPGGREQADLIRLLSGEEFMQTDEDGTTPKQLMQGLEKYLQQAGYECHVEQMGWRSAYQRIGRVPDEKWMLKSCIGTSNVLINIGFYTREGETFTRTTGHWITLVGFRQTEKGGVLLVHDPAPRDGVEKKTTECHLKLLPEEGELIRKEGKPIPSKGYFELAGVKLKKGAEVGIVDAAVAFQVGKK